MSLALNLGPIPVPLFGRMQAFVPRQNTSDPTGGGTDQATPAAGSASSTSSAPATSPSSDTSTGDGTTTTDPADDDPYGDREPVDGQCPTRSEGNARYYPDNDGVCRWGVLPPVGQCQGDPEGQFCSYVLDLERAGYYDTTTEALPRTQTQATGPSQAAQPGQASQDPQRQGTPAQPTQVAQPDSPEQQSQAVQPNQSQAQQPSQSPGQQQTPDANAPSAVGTPSASAPGAPVPSEAAGAGGDAAAGPTGTGGSGAAGISPGAQLVSVSGSTALTSLPARVSGSSAASSVSIGVLPGAATGSRGGGGAATSSSAAHTVCPKGRGEGKLGLFMVGVALSSVLVGSAFIL